jgi:small subunit ribosomal protein S4
MARYTGPMTKKSRRLGVDLVGGDSAFERRPYPPGQHGRGRIKESEYLLQLREKQKARYSYGILEKQFHRYYVEASRRPGKTGDNLLQLLECRLDNVVYRAGFARTRRHARQLVVHGHFKVNGRKVDIPSFQVSSHDVIDVREKSLEMTRDPRRARRPRVAGGDPVPHAHPRSPASGPGPDRHPGPGAADRRVLLQEVSPRGSSPWTAPQLLATAVRAHQMVVGPGKERISAYRSATDPVGRIR